MTRLISVQTQAQIADVAGLAREIWTEHYVPIIGQKQVDYMLDNFQSETAIAAQLAEGFEYDIAMRDGNRVGYLALSAHAAPGELMLSKLYVAKAWRGQGIGRTMLAFAEDVCRKRRLRTLWLTVNKHNARSIAWYNRMGFTNAGGTVQDIGAGFKMDDYRMEKRVGDVFCGVLNPPH